MTKTAKGIVAGGISGLSEQIKSLTEENDNLRKENTDLKAWVDKIETATKVAEQYSRRNCIRYPGTIAKNGMISSCTLHELCMSI